MPNYEITGKDNEQVGLLLKLALGGAVVGAVVAASQEPAGFKGHDYTPAPADTPITEESGSDIDPTGDYADLLSKYMDGVEITEEYKEGVADFLENSGIMQPESDVDGNSPQIEPIEGTDFAVDDSNP